ncbi:MAG: Sucrase/ferredoxin-like protein [Nocardioides sp.]|jgi:(2Fe-2S) ferredoxin|uniref:sucrase ferredoxin n=1 Tax=Nocardioides sp. TaxID=35761 RepID=UPI00261C70C6|nr:sucrase ferredoxin [Nocardioides sp.]MCW2834837.1 Sucrase/ferredoxin-like protein [Nocardioides sp.]
MTFRCSDGALERGDPIVGTAPPQRDWLLVEHPGPWPVNAPFDTDLPTALLRRLEHPRLRILLIRPHGREAGRRESVDPARRRWFRCVEGELRTGQWDHPDDLLATSEPGAGAPYPGPLVLVCTHGVHDVCCAIKGRPVAAALAREWREGTFECSHLGGDRFAPNVLLLPDGACYAGMSPEQSVTTVAAHLQGRVDVDRLRGVVGLHPAEQVAQAAVLRRWGPAPVTSALPALVEQTGTVDAGTWTVEVVGTAPLPRDVRVLVTSSRRAQAQLTCRAPRETQALQWDVVSLKSG